MHRLVVIAADGNQIEPRLAQAGLHLQQIALGDIPLVETPLDHAVERFDDIHVLLDGAQEQRLRRHAPVGIVGHVTHFEPRVLLVEQRPLVTALGLTIGRPDASAAIDGLHELRLHRETPQLVVAYMVKGLG